jgi:hypothetical protein
MDAKKVFDMLSPEASQALRMAILTRVDFVLDVYKHDSEAREQELAGINQLRKELGMT